MIIVLSQRKRVSGRIWRQTCLGENTEKVHNLSVLIKKKVQELIKKGKKSQKPYLTDHNLLLVQDLWKAHYQILLIILLKEFIKSNINTDKMVENVKLLKLNKRLRLLSLIHKL